MTPPPRRITRSDAGAAPARAPARRPEQGPAKAARRAAGDESSSPSEDDEMDDDDDDDGEGTVPHKDHPSERSRRSNDMAVVPDERPAQTLRMDAWLDGEGALPHPPWDVLTGDLTPLPHKGAARYDMQYEFLRALKNIKKLMVKFRLLATVAEPPGGVHVNDSEGAGRTEQMVQVHHMVGRCRLTVSKPTVSILVGPL
jgi:hypothetical protein